MPTATSQLAELINALASLAWPLVLFFFLWLFSSEITALFKRFTRLKGPGGFEVELSDALENLGRKTQEAALTLPDGVTQSEQRDDSGRGPDEGEGIEPAKTPEPPDQGPGGESKQPDGDEELLLADQDIDEKPSSGETRPGVLNAWTKYLQEHPELLRENPELLRDRPELYREPSRLAKDPNARDLLTTLRRVGLGEVGRAPIKEPAAKRKIDRILGEAAVSPRTALITLAIELERKSREILVSKGEPRLAPRGGLARQLNLLDLSPPLQGAAKEFQRVRNLIIHGHSATDADALRAVDFGIEILAALESIPHEVNYVEASFVETFADAAGKERHPFHAVVLRSMHPPDGKEELRAYPVAKSNLPVGEPVTWEWNMEHVYPEAWYRSPRDDTLSYGWTEAAEFDGRPIHGVGARRPAWIDRLS